MNRGAPIPETVTLHIPFRVVKRGGRKEMQLPEGAEQPRRTDNTLIKALTRAFRWKRMLESGEFVTIAELAEREGIAPSYMTRILRLTLLAPDIVEEILDGTQGPEVTLARLLATIPVEWAAQTDHLGQIAEASIREWRGDRPESAYSGRIEIVAFAHAANRSPYRTGELRGSAAKKAAIRHERSELQGVDPDSQNIVTGVLHSTVIIRELRSALSSGSQFLSQGDPI